MQAEDLPQRDVGHDFATHINHVPAVGPVDVGMREFDALQHAAERQHEIAAGQLHQQAVDDGERQRQLERDDGAAAGHALNLDRTTQSLDVARHYVHAHAAARDGADVFGRRETRREDQLKELLLAGLGVTRQQALGDGLLPDGCGIESAAVVLDCDQHVGAGVLSCQMNASLHRFTGRPTLFGRLDAMIDAVANQVHERIAELVDHGFVEFSLGAGRGEFDFLAKFRGQVPHQTLETGEGRADRQHADIHDLIAQFGREPLDILGQGRQIRVAPPGGEL
ncbi:MAG: hypothetical protein BWY87_00836 [Deltaproteobacteria bacterium ADurb.Bin510]|nr:MAG: hypothetical protein BWY87_00836 [Deltaproteobacteria bacterium ADurb.Bin510]